MAKVIRAGEGSTSLSNMFPWAGRMGRWGDGRSDGCLGRDEHDRRMDQHDGRELDDNQMMEISSYNTPCAGC